MSDEYSTKTTVQIANILIWIVTTQKNFKYVSCLIHVLQMNTYGDKVVALL